MFIKSSAALITLALGFTVSAFASDLAYPLANESGTAYRTAEYVVRGGSLVRVDELNAAGSASTQADDQGAFVYRGDGTGWEVAEHKLVFTGGRLVHSNECDHAVHTAMAPTPVDVDKARLQSPGA